MRRLNHISFLIFQMEREASYHHCVGISRNVRHDVADHKRSHINNHTLGLTSMKRCGQSVRVKKICIDQATFPATRRKPAVQA